MFERLSNPTRRAITLAQAEVSGMKHTYIDTHHILLGLMAIEDPAVSNVVDSLGLTVANVRSRLMSIFPSETENNEIRFNFTADATSALRVALGQSLALASSTIDPVHLLTGVLDTRGPGIIAIFDELDEDLDDVVNYLKGKTSDDFEPVISEDSSPDALPVRNKEKLSILPKFASNLVQAAKDGQLDTVTGREVEIERLVTILCRRSKNNPVLLGEAGVGKTAVVEGFAQRVASGDVPDMLKNRDVWSLDLPSVIGGTQYRGDFEERIKNLVKELKETNAIVFIDEVHTLVGAGDMKNTGSGASDLLKPALSRGELTLIGATTSSEYKRIEKDPALERRFAPVHVEAPDFEQTLNILKSLRPAYESYHKVSLTDAALETAVRLSVSYIPDRQLPDKAIDVIDETGAAATLARLVAVDSTRELYEARFDIQEKRRVAIEEDNFTLITELTEQETTLTAEILAVGEDVLTLDSEDVASIVSMMTGVNVKLLSKNETDRLLHLEELLSERVIGQDIAKSLISKGVRRRRSGVAAARPDSYIFAGPTGVGKTELVKALSEAVTGDVKHLVQIDMSEYGEKHSLSRLIGSPPGYVGFGEPGMLTEPVKRAPSSVILLDEIEKAHPDIFNLFLQILEDGHLSDASGKKVDFSNTTVIFTTNLGASFSKSLGFKASGVAGDNQSRKDREEITLKALKDNFRPEFLNRIDHSIIFDPLTLDDVRLIANIMVKRIETVLSKRNITLNVTDEALMFLTESGFSSEFGARPLKRAIQKLLEDKLSEALLRDEIKDFDVVDVTFDKELQFKVKSKILA